MTPGSQRLLPGWLRRAAAAALAAAALAAPAARAQESLETPIKATFLHRFAEFVEWPEEAFDGPFSPFTICLVGRDGFGRMLDEAVSGQGVQGRPVVILRLQTLTAESACQIAYVAGSAQQSAADALAAVRGAPVLTVTDGSRGSARGVIHFEVTQNRVRFHVDEEAAVEAGLEISSRLLGVSLSVRRRPQ